MAIALADGSYTKLKLRRDTLCSENAVKKETQRKIRQVETKAKYGLCVGYVVNIWRRFRAKDDDGESSSCSCLWQCLLKCIADM